MRGIVSAQARAGRRDGRAMEELGECLLAAEQPRTAQAYFAEAHVLLSTDPYVLQDPPRLERLKRLAKG